MKPSSNSSPQQQRHKCFLCLFHLRSRQHRPRRPRPRRRVIMSHIRRKSFTRKLSIPSRYAMNNIMLMIRGVSGLPATLPLKFVCTSTPLETFFGCFVWFVELNFKPLFIQPTNPSTSQPAFLCIIIYLFLSLCVVDGSCAILIGSKSLVSGSAPASSPSSPASTGSCSVCCVAWALSQLSTLIAPVCFPPPASSSPIPPRLCPHPLSSPVAIIALYS